MIQEAIEIFEVLSLRGLLNISELLYYILSIIASGKLEEKSQEASF